MSPRAWGRKIGLMSQMIDIHDAQSRLLELIDALARTGAVVITRDEQAVARLSAPETPPSLRTLKPVSLGAPLMPLERDDDLRDEMLRS